MHGVRGTKQAGDTVYRAGSVTGDLVAGADLLQVKGEHDLAHLAGNHSAEGNIGKAASDANEEDAGVKLTEHVATRAARNPRDGTGTVTRRSVVHVETVQDRRRCV